MIDYFDPRQAQMAERRFSRFAWLLADAGWMVLCMGAVVLFTIGIGAALSTVMGYMGLLFALLAVVALSMRARTVRRARAMIAIAYLEQAARLNLPFPPMLEAAEASERGATRRRLHKLRTEIEGGAPVAIALRRAAPGGPPRALGLIAAGERLGRLPQALRRATEAERATLLDRRQVLQSIMLRWYPMVMLVGVVPMFALMMIFVVPKYRQIFKDFGLPLPAATSWLLNVWDSLATPLLVPALGLILLVACARMFADLMPMRRPPSRRRGVLDPIAWFVPPWRGVTRHRGLADACHVIADALAAGQPADRAIAEASAACVNRVLRNRVLRWAGLSAQGVPLADAARDAKLPPLVWGMLRSAEGTAGVTDAFAFLARYYDARYSTAAALLRGAAIPLMVAVMAFVVLTLALGLFMPLVDLMNHLPAGRGKGVL